MLYLLDLLDCDMVYVGGGLMLLFMSGLVKVVFVEVG